MAAAFHDDPHGSGPAAAAADALLADAAGACVEHGRDDLLDRLHAARGRLVDPSTRLLVVGEFKQGKSTLVNALLDVAVCPVDDDVATSVPTVVGYAPQPAAVAWYEGEGDGDEGDGDEGDGDEGDGDAPVSETIPLDRLAEYVSEAGNPGNRRRLRAVEVGVPSELLRPGLSLVDTPGVGGLGSAHGAVTVAAVPAADAVLLVTDASQELTEPELAFLHQARDLCPNLVVVLTKCDLYPEWRKIADLDRDHLDRQGFGDVGILPASSVLRLHALRTGDSEVHEESGFGRLLAYLHDDVLAVGAALSVRTAASAVYRTAREVVAGLEAERAALTDPADAARIQQDLRAAEARAVRLLDDAARWRTTLHDGVADLTADADHDLQQRVRGILSDAEARIAAGDPAVWWEEFADWLRQRVAAEVSGSYALLVRGAEALSQRVAEHFAAAEEEVDEVVEEAADAGRIGEAVVDAEAPADLLADLGGLPVFRLLAGTSGLGTIAPAAAGAGLLLGRRTVRDEQQRQLEERRRQAVAEVRRFVEEVAFELGKDSRDALRGIQRRLRDGFSERAEQVRRGVEHRVRAVEEGARAQAEARGRRVGEVEAALARNQALAERALRLAPDLGSGDDFLTGVRALPDRALVTILFTDIVGSTRTAVELGDAAWRRLLDEHHDLVRTYLERFEGREVDTAGDGFLAVFDAPARAVLCATSIAEAVRSLGLEIRAGLHTGEVELRGQGVAGLAVHVGARVAARAGAGEVLTSRTVKDLVAGSGISFEDRGTHELKGVPGRWQIFAASGSR